MLIIFTKSKHIIAINFPIPYLSSKGEIMREVWKEIAHELPYFMMLLTAGILTTMAIVAIFMLMCP
jgi:hypothetical protein